MAEGGCGARPLELDAVRDGEDSEATAAAIEGDEAIVALGESCECVVAITGDTTMLFRLKEHAVCSNVATLFCTFSNPRSVSKWQTSFDEVRSVRNLETSHLINA